MVGYMGEFYEHLECYEEAFECWDRAIELADKYIHWMFSKVFCYQRLERKQEELNQWKAIVSWLEVKGFEDGAEKHRQNIIRLEEELTAGKVNQKN